MVTLGDIGEYIALGLVCFAAFVWVLTAVDIWCNRRRIRSTEIKSLSAFYSDKSRPTYKMFCVAVVVYSVSSILWGIVLFFHRRKVKGETLDDDLAFSFGEIFNFFLLAQLFPVNPEGQTICFNLHKVSLNKIALSRLLHYIGGGSFLIALPLMQLVVYVRLLASQHHPKDSNKLAAILVGILLMFGIAIFFDKTSAKSDEQSRECTINEFDEWFTDDNNRIPLGEAAARGIFLRRREVKNVMMEGLESGQNVIVLSPNGRFWCISELESGYPCSCVLKTEPFFERSYFFGLCKFNVNWLHIWAEWLFIYCEVALLTYLFVKKGGNHLD